MVSNNKYQKMSEVLHTFALNKSFGPLLDISSESVIISKTSDS